MLKYIRLSVGDPAPDFTQRSTSGMQFHFNKVAGRYIALCFLGKAGTPFGQASVDFIRANRALFDDKKLTFFGVSIDPDDERLARLRGEPPGVRYFWDFDASVSRAYGALPVGQREAQGEPLLRPLWYILDPNLRVLKVLSCTDFCDGQEQLARFLAALPAVDEYAGTNLNAPVLIIPRVFEPEFCRDLIDAYAGQGGAESGFMVERNGLTVVAHDERRKRRMDFSFSSGEAHAPLRTEVRKRVERRIRPEVEKAFQFSITRIERYLVACYDESNQGFFAVHRDNTTKGTAHRRFACTINLNPHEYEGGDLVFREFGTRRYRAPLGGAIVFSCSLLHEATRVTKGTRYAFVPFFHDEEAERVRSENARYLDLTTPLRVAPR